MYVDIYSNETVLGPSLETVQARARTATGSGRCTCGSKRDADPRVRRVGSRTWTVCRRCFGQVKQLS